MSNKVEVSDFEVKRRAKILYGKKKYAVMEQNWALWEDKGWEDKVKVQLDSFRARMYDLSQFMKTFNHVFPAGKLSPIQTVTGPSRPEGMRVELGPGPLIVQVLRAASGCPAS